MSKLNIKNIFYLRYTIKLFLILFNLNNLAFSHYKNKYNFNIELLIEKIYNKVYKIKPSILFILSFCTYVCFDKSSIFIELSHFLLLMSILIKLIIIYQSQFLYYSHLRKFNLFVKLNIINNILNYFYKIFDLNIK